MAPGSSSLLLTDPTGSWEEGAWSHRQPHNEPALKPQYNPTSPWQEPKRGQVRGGEEVQCNTNHRCYLESGRAETGAAQGPTWFLHNRRAFRGHRGPRQPHHSQTQKGHHHPAQEGHKGPAPSTGRASSPPTAHKRGQGTAPITNPQEQVPTVLKGPHCQAPAPSGPALPHPGP